MIVSSRSKPGQLADLGSFSRVGSKKYLGISCRFLVCLALKTRNLHNEASIPPQGVQVLYNNITEAVGNTPLVKLNRVAAQLDCNLYAKM